MTTDASTAHRDPTASHAEALAAENVALRAENTSLRLARTKARGEAVGFAISSAWALGIIAVFVLGATARTCAYGIDARRNAEREATEYHRRTSGAPPFAVMCSDSRGGGDAGKFDRSCLVYRVAADPRPLLLRCDSDPPRWNDGCHELGRTP